MPWEVTIRRADGAPLGGLAAVQQQITAAVPAVEFRREPSGLEQIAAASAARVEFPEIIRQHLVRRPATELAEFAGDRFSIVLYGFEAQPLAAIHAEVRGDGNPVPALAALCRSHAWVAVDDASGEPVDLGAAEAAGWQAFRAYRDRAIRDIDATERGES